MTGQLVRKDSENGFQAKCTVAKIVKIPEGRPEEVEHHGPIITLYAEPFHERYPNAPCKGLVDLRLVFQLGMFHIDGLELNGYFLARKEVYPEINNT
jgi:hypothetical protein